MGAGIREEVGAGIGAGVGGVDCIYMPASTVLSVPPEERVKTAVLPVVTTASESTATLPPWLAGKNVSHKQYKLN